MIARLLKALARFRRLELVALILAVATLPLLVLATVLGVVLDQLQPAYAAFLVYVVITGTVTIIALVRRRRLYVEFQKSLKRSRAGYSILGHDDETRAWASLADSPAADIALVARTTWALSEPRLVKYGLRTRSKFALDVMAHRVTDNRFGFDELVSIARTVAADPQQSDLMLPFVKFSSLIGVCRFTSSGQQSTEATNALLDLAFHRREGASFDDLVFLARLLILEGRRDQAREIVAGLRGNNWVRQLMAADLVNPFVEGIDEDEVRNNQWLTAANEVFRTTGLERIALNPPREDGDAFDRITCSDPLPDVAGDELVTVIMTTYEPDVAVETAVRSIISQTWQNWELLIMDDASGEDFSPALDALEALDSRITVIRAAENAGTYVRRNEALQRARGVFVTMQDSDDWAHPRRLELQVQHLRAHPELPANTVYSMRVSRELLFVQPRGVWLRLSEPAILFRRELVLGKLGYFDTVRRGADTEYRLRMQAVFKFELEPIPTIAPLVLMRFDFASLSGSDFSDGWTHPARFAYRSAHRLWRERELAAKKVPYLPFPQEKRQFIAPAHLGGAPVGTHRVDVLVVLDGRQKSAPEEVGKAMASEIRALTTQGLRVGLLHVTSLRRNKSSDELMAPIQDCISEGVALQFHVDETVEAGVVLVRHAGAVMGLPNVDSPVVSTNRVVVVDDSVAGYEADGRNFTPGWVRHNVTAYFGVHPEWWTNPSKRPLDIADVIGA